jgi:hypothetical protein
MASGSSRAPVFLVSINTAELLFPSTYHPPTTPLDYTKSVYVYRRYWAITYTASRPFFGKVCLVIFLFLFKATTTSTGFQYLNT